MKILIASDIFKNGVSRYTYDEAEDLEIVGNIPANAEVEIKSERNSNIVTNGRIVNFTDGISFMRIANGVIYTNGQRVDTASRGIISGNSMSQACANLTITGNVGQRAKIFSTSSNITVNGNIEQGATVKTINGTINANVVRSNAEVRATNGAINVDEIHSNAEVSTTNGAINANVVHSNAEVRTTNGAINANVVHNNAEVRTTNGNVRINYDRRSRRESRRSHNRDNPLDPNFGANLSTYISNIVGATFSDSFFPSNNFHSEMSSSDSEDDTVNRSNRMPQRQTAQPTAPSMAVNEDLPPSYEEVVESGAAAAAGLPPAYSEMPKEGETTIASNLSGSTTNSLSNNLRRR